MIHVYKNWYIDSDRYQYILFKKQLRIDKETGEEYEARDNMTYHPTVSDALTSLCRTLGRRFINENDVELEEAIEKFKKIEKVVIGSISDKEM